MRVKGQLGPAPIHRLFAWTLFLLFALSPALSRASDTPSEYLKVRALGFSSGAGLAARNRAKNEGEQNALRIFVESLIGREQLVHVRETLESSGTYIQSSRVLNFSEVDGGTRADVEIYVREQLLRHDLAMLILPHLPLGRSVIIVCREDGPFPGGSGASVVEEGLASAFHSSGFQTTTSSELLDRYTPGELLARVQGGEATLGKLGRENRTDIVLGCSAALDVDESGPASPFARVKATVSARIIRAGDSSVAEAVVGEAAVHGVDPSVTSRQAIQDAVTKISDQVLVSAILSLALAEKRDAYWLTLRNPRSTPVVQAVAATLRNILHIQDVEMLRFSSDEALLSFTYGGRTRDLAETLEHTDQEMFRLEFSQVVEHTLIYDVLPK